MVDYIRVGVEEPIIDPSEYVKRENIVLPTDKCILTFSSRTTRTIIDFMEKYESMPIKIPIFDPTIGEYSGTKIFTATLNVGAPASVMALELLIAAGAKKIIIIGAAGSTHPDVEIGDIFLPTWGIREEGTSYHYMPPNYKPKPNRTLLNRLKSEIEKISQGSIKIVEGGVWSIDAVFRETKDKMREYRKKGVVGVDMESTALMTVADYRGVALAIALIISDELREDSWIYVWESEKIIKSERILSLASLRALV